MYADSYRKMSEIAERIRSGEYHAEQKQKRAETSSFMQRQKPKPVETERSELDAMAEMIAMLRNQVDEARPAVKKVSAGPTNPAEVGKRLMSDLMQDFGITSDQAAGIVGNLDYESGGFKSMQEISPTVKGSRGGYGYAQWTGPRRVEFESWAEANGLDVNSYEANYGNLKRELTSTAEGKVMDSIRGVTTPEESARVFSEQFLRPGKVNMSGRIKRTYNYLETPDV